MQLVKKQPIDNIWIEWENDGENLEKAFSIICGPENTPYQHGFYIFNFDFSGDYPFINPGVYYNNIGASIPQLKQFKEAHSNSHTPRAHPNLYKNGYVCLSLLGTWRGQSWTSCFNIQSISVELQSLLNSNPITNEPSFEGETGEISKLYIFMITHMNIRTSVLGMLKNTPDKYMPLRHKMIEYFIKHFDSYIEICDKYTDHKWNKKTLTFKLYKWQEYINFNKLKRELKKLKKELDVEYAELTAITT